MATVCQNQGTKVDGIAFAVFGMRIVFPLAIVAIALAYRRRYLWAALVVGATFNLHALTAAYALVFLLAAAMVDTRPRRWISWRLAIRAGLVGILFVAAASPTLRT